MISFTAKRDGGRKDTLANILETNEFVVNLAARWFLDRMHQASAEYPEGVDERELVGLKALPSIRVKPVRVQESPVQLECRLAHTVQIGPEGAPGSSTVVFGQIVMAHVRADAYKNGRLDPRMLEPVARLGGHDYGVLGEIITREAAEVPT
jgi:flavin reductase (DIM6/NTAB) family NADH-FMN oxidoreductase RutF